jgi:HNH endonuclease/AP2 domain
MKTNSLSIDRVKHLLDYEKSTGTFSWRERDRSEFKTHLSWHCFETRFCGKRAGNSHASGYTYISIDAKLYAAHRLVWLMENHKWPDGEIDHINRVRSDNRIENLRDVTRAQNMQNKSLYRSNKSGHRGVFWVPECGKWRAVSPCVGGKKVSLGLHWTIEEALKAQLDHAQMRQRPGL